MIMDIGSIFPLSDRNSADGIEFNEESLLTNWGKLYSLCREALYELAVKFGSEKRILIPAYTCSTVYAPFIQAGYECVFYNIKYDLTIDIDDLITKYRENHSDICLIHPFYGMGFSCDEESAFRFLKANGCIIVEDLTQSLFKKKCEFADYSVGSLRKWFPIPDGAFLSPCENGYTNEKDESYFNEFLQDQIDAMYLRGVYFQTADENIKQISVRLNKRAVKTSYERIIPHSMSILSKIELLKQDMDFVQGQRITNYKFLHDNIHENEMIHRAVSDIGRLVSAPLYFPIYCDERQRVQSELAKEHIYAPILWGFDEAVVEVSNEVRQIYDTILCIPIDQRYSITDMEKVVKMLNNVRL